MTSEQYEKLCTNWLEISFAFTAVIWVAWAIGRFAYTFIEVK